MARGKVHSRSRLLEVSDSLPQPYPGEAACSVCDKVIEKLTFEKGEKDGLIPDLISVI